MGDSLAQRAALTLCGTARMRPRGSPKRAENLDSCAERRVAPGRTFPSA